MAISGDIYEPIDDDEHKAFGSAVSFSCACNKTDEAGGQGCCCGEDCCCSPCGCGGGCGCS